MNEKVVIIGSSYAHKCRVGLWFCNGTMEKIRECVVKLHNSGVNFSTHMNITTRRNTVLKKSTLSVILTKALTNSNRF